MRISAYRTQIAASRAVAIAASRLAAEMSSLAALTASDLSPDMRPLSQASRQFEPLIERIRQDLGF
jgi:hypothetical protein